MGLTPKQQRFVDEYLVDLNATQAAIRAGYSKKTARVQGCRLLTYAAVAKAIEAGRAVQAETAIVTREQVLRELKRIGMSDIRKLYDETGRLKKVTELDDDTAAAVSSVEFEEVDRAEIGRTVKIKCFDKTKALETLGRHLGLWKDPERPPTEGPGMTVIIEQRAYAKDGSSVAANQVVVNLQPPG